MSVEIMGMVFRTRLPAGQRLVLLSLADFANRDGRSVYPSQASTARRCGMGTSTVRRHLEALEAMGILAEVRAPGGAERRAREYLISVSALEQLVATAEPPSAQNGQVAECPQRAVPSAQNGHQDKYLIQEPQAKVPAVPSPRPRDLIWDVFAELLGAHSNDGERQKRARAVKLVRQSLGVARAKDATVLHAAILRTRIERALRLWAPRGIPVTDMGIANNWRLLGDDTTAATLTLEDMARQAGAA